MSTAAPLVRLLGVGKRYVRYEEQPTLLSALGHLAPRRRRARIWALRDCSLELSRGESLGVMGLNGSGKSTLLQVMAGVTAPSEGEVRVGGRIAPLIQVGVGFHPELTGRENVYVNATILGLTRERIDALFDEIVDFAELAEVIDTPVKFYSSGMYVRLGFSVAAAASPDVLLVDEVLAVGDIAFQLKSVERMERTIESGAAMVLVSHNVHLIRRLCARSLVLQQGRVIFDGGTDEAISAFYQSVGRRPSAGGPAGAGVPGGDEVSVDVEVLDRAGRPTRHVVTGDTVTVRLDGRLGRSVESATLGIIVSNAGGVQVYREMFPGRLGARRDPGRLACSFEITLGLAHGTYYVDAGILEGGFDLGQVVAWSRPVLFHVSGRELVDGAVDLGARVRIDAGEAAAGRVGGPGEAGAAGRGEAAP